MAGVGPYGIEQFNAAGVIGAYQDAQTNRIRTMLYQKQLDALDKQEKDQAGVHKAVSAYLGENAPAASPQPATAVVHPSGPVTVGAPAAPQAAPAAPRPTAADREKLFNSLVAINPETAGQYMDAFSKMDKAQADHYAMVSNKIVSFAAGLMQMDPKDRPAALKQAAPQAQELGIDPQHLDALDLSDQGLRSLIVQHLDGEKVLQFVKPDLVVVGNSLVDKNHPEKGAVYSAPEDFKQFMVKNADGSETPYGIDPKTGHAFQLRDYGAPGAQYQGGDAGGFDHAVETVLKNEGGYAAHDMNGSPVNFGINQGANPDVDVKSLTRAQAKQIYHDKYWVPSGAESLPANLQTPYFDVYIRNPKAAQRALEESGGDPAKFMASASAYFTKLGKTPNGQKYAKAWANRDKNNLAIATGVGGGVPDGGIPITGKAAPANTEDDETAKFIGGQVALGQPMPPLGMGKEAAAMRRAILAEATKQWKAMGISPGEANVIAADNKSGLAELAKIAQMKATVQTAENTASANAKSGADLARRGWHDRLSDLQRLAASRAPGDRRCQGFRLRCRGQDALDRICPRDER
jgi:hypothetical protein